MAILETLKEAFGISFIGAGHPPRRNRRDYNRISGEPRHHGKRSPRQFVSGGRHGGGFALAPILHHPRPCGDQ